jgi:hypothetical protein
MLQVVTVRPRRAHEGASRRIQEFIFEACMPFTVPLATSLFLMGAASGALLVSFRFAALRERIRAQVTEDLRTLQCREYRMQDSILAKGRRSAMTACRSADRSAEHTTAGHWTRSGRVTGMSRNFPERE